ncbi:MAG: ATP-grasp domain-containing protein, partial [Proteobacteria bacterium]|nr:ATP-grasp domain-containing protein [Pseudomonadota bacterium]
MMQVAVVYNEPAADAGPAEADVLEQVQAVMQALKQCGHIGWTQPCTHDLASLDKALNTRRPDVVFNLVEALGGTDRLSMLVPFLLDARHLPYTGNGSLALAATIDKIAVKTRLKQAGVPTPDWVAGDTIDPTEHRCGRYILKARTEHASLGIGDDAIVETRDLAALKARITRQSARLATPCFAERYVPGREFNIALLAGGDGVQVLPPAEIDFGEFGPDQPHIVGHAAKWQPDSFEFQSTPRVFDFAERDADLLATLTRLTAQVWDRLDLRGYARVDFRVDHAGQPWVLEVNPNPCI